jgi:hypothetical protein
VWTRFLRSNVDREEKEEGKERRGRRADESERRRSPFETNCKSTEKKMETELD